MSTPLRMTLGTLCALWALFAGSTGDPGGAIACTLVALVLYTNLK